MISRKLTSQEVVHLESFFEEEPDPIEWIEENIEFPAAGYNLPCNSHLKIKSFQKFIIRYALGHVGDFQPHYINFMGSVQLAKTLIGNCIQYYFNRFRSSNSFLCFATEDKAREMLKGRLIPTIKNNPELSKFWSGKEDDLSSGQITLTNGIIRVATAESENSIASHGGQFIHGSEVAKYQSRFDAISKLFGRKNAYEETGDFLIYLESSPKSRKDPFGVVCSETPQLYPYVKFPCGHWNFMTDLIIVVKKDSDGNTLKEPKKLLTDENNAWFECPLCKEKVFQKSVNKMLSNVIWAENQDQIYGNNEQQPAFKYDRVTFNCNKLYSGGYKITECMADYFSALYRNDGGLSFKEYQNETMGRCAAEDDSKFSDENLFRPDKMIIRDYKIKLKYPIYPQQIDFALLGADTQVDCIYFVIFGFELGSGNIFLMDNGKVVYKTRDESSYSDTYLEFYKRTYGKSFVRQDGNKIPLLGGLQDSGGHNLSLVKYISHKIPRHYMYKGSSTSSKMKTLIEKSKEEYKLYMGNSEELSKRVLQHMYCIDGYSMFLPEDYEHEFVKQLDTEIFDTKKGKIVRTSSVNHYRSATNYLLGAADVSMFDAFNGNQEKIKLIMSQEKKELTATDDKDLLEQLMEEEKKTQEHNMSEYKKLLGAMSGRRFR